LKWGHICKNICNTQHVQTVGWDVLGNTLDVCVWDCTVNMVPACNRLGDVWGTAAAILLNL